MTGAELRAALAALGLQHVQLAALTGEHPVTIGHRAREVPGYPIPRWLELLIELLGEERVLLDGQQAAIDLAVSTAFAAARASRQPRQSAPVAPVAPVSRKSVRGRPRRHNPPAWGTPPSA